MNPNSNGTRTSEILLESLAHQLGQDAFDKAKDHASEVIAWEKIRREKSNLSEITALKARYDCLFRRRAALLETLRLAPIDDSPNARHKRWYYRGFALSLILAGIFFAHLAIAPFGLGWETWILCFGIACVATFWTDRTLAEVNCSVLLKSVCLLALLASMTGIFIMALLRGDILAFYLKTAAGATPDTATATAFYAHATWKLQIFMALLAIAMELGSGVAMFEAGKLELGSHEKAAHARDELAHVEGEMVSIIRSVTHLENDHVINEAEFWRNFHLGLFERIKRSGLLHFVILFACFAFGGANPSSAQTLASSSTANNRVSVVIALDFTQSVAGKGYDGKTDFEKNVEAACHLITQLPPGTEIAVLAITDRSFSQPLILVRRELPRDKGPLQFLDRIAVAKAQAASELRSVALSSRHSLPQTDIFGALTLAADILNKPSDRKVLILFSDMRQSTAELDFERAKAILPVQTLATATKLGMLAHLQGVEVYALGVDGAGKSFAYWTSLHGFWEAYFQKAGASLKEYSALRDSPDFGQESR
jgi:hypothetical protein